jgi:hypothetical protein
MIKNNMSDTKPKKRGRKPKNNIIINENPVFESPIDNFVIKLKHQEENIVKDILPGYEVVSSEIDTTEVKLCWNCCHESCNKHKYGVPLKYSEGIFYTYGHFCTIECTARYIFDNFKHKELWDKYALLNLFYNITNNTIGEQVYIPPNRLLLQSFGGELTIDDYRYKNNNYDIQIPPVIPISHSINKHIAKTKIKDNNSKLKLYRKKDITEKQDIFKKMNIKN